MSPLDHLDFVAVQSLGPVRKPAVVVPISCNLGEALKAVEVVADAVRCSQLPVGHCTAGAIESCSGTGGFSVHYVLTGSPPAVLLAGTPPDSSHAGGGAAVAAYVLRQLQRAMARDLATLSYLALRGELARAEAADFGLDGAVSGGNRPVNSAPSCHNPPANNVKGIDAYLEGTANMAFDGSWGGTTAPEGEQLEGLGDADLEWLEYREPVAEEPPAEPQRILSLVSSLGDVASPVGAAAQPATPPEAVSPTPASAGAFPSQAGGAWDASFFNTAFGGGSPAPPPPATVGSPATKLQRAPSALGALQEAEDEDRNEASPPSTPLPQIPASVFLGNLGPRLSPPGSPPGVPPVIQEVAEEAGAGDAWASFDFGGGPAAPPPPPKRVFAAVAVSEDLACVYKGGTLQSLVIDGSVLVSACEAPYQLLLNDGHGHLAAVKVNGTYTKQLPKSETDTTRRYLCQTASEWTPPSTMDWLDDAAGGGSSGDQPKGPPKYLPALLYRCTPSLRPVPVRVQCRARGVEGGAVRISIQVTANPTLSRPLVGISVMAQVPPALGPLGGSAPALEPPGEWAADRRILTWKIAGLQPGGKQLVEAQLDFPELSDPSAVPGAVPIVVQCQSPDAMLSGVAVQLAPHEEPGQPHVEFSNTVTRRFRVQCKQDP